MISRQAVVTIGVCGAILLGVPYLRTLLEARAAYNAGEVSRVSGGSSGALSYYTSAVSWRSPGNIWASRAVERVQELLRSLPDSNARLAGLLELRRALQRSRSFLHSDRDPLLLQTDAAIHAISPEALTPKVKDLRAPVVNYSQQIGAQIFFWLWLLLTLAWIWRGFTPEARLRYDKSVLLGCGAVVSYVLWVWVL